MYWNVILSFLSGFIDKLQMFLFIFRQLHQNENEKEENDVEFFIVLCHDLFFEVLQYGNRLQLTKLAVVGRRIYRFIELYFEQAPFHLLNIRLNPRPRFFHLPPFSMFILVFSCLIRKVLNQSRKSSRKGTLVLSCFYSTGWIWTL